MSFLLEANKWMRPLFAGVCCVVLSIITCNLASAQADTIGRSFTIEQTTKYIMDKYEDAAFYKDQWWRLQYSNPWFVFEWKTRPNGVSYYYVAVDLRKVKETGVMQFNTLYELYDILRADEPTYVTFTCVITPCAKYETTAEDKTFRQDHFRVGPAIVDPGETRRLARAFDHLIALHPKVSDPFAR